MTCGVTDNDRYGRLFTTSAGDAARVALTDPTSEDITYARLLADVTRSRNALPDDLGSHTAWRPLDGGTLYQSFVEVLAPLSAGCGDLVERISEWERHIGADQSTTMTLFGRLVDVIVLEQILAAVSQRATLDLAGLCVKRPGTWPPQPTVLTADYVYLDAMHLSIMTVWRPTLSRTVRSVFVQYAEDVGADNLRYLVEAAAEAAAEVKFCHAMPGTGLVALSPQQSRTATSGPQVLTLAPDVILPRSSSRWRRTTHASELVVTGDQVARNGETPSTGTGVLARWENNGDVAFAGLAPITREHRGYTIDLRHLEKTIAACSAVLRVSVAEVPDYTERIVAVCCIDPARVDEGRAAVTSGLRDLPDYATPSPVFVTDLRHLTQWSAAHVLELAAHAATHISASTEEVAEPVLDVVRGAWQRALRMSDVPADAANFFAEGGNSLHATSIAAALHRKLGVDLDFALLLSKPVLVEFAAEVARLDTAKNDMPRHAQRPESFESSYEQLQLYLLEARHGDARINNTACAWHLEGTVDPRVLAEAIRYVVGRHQSLQLCFQEADGHLLCTEIRDAELPTLHTRFVADVRHDPTRAVQEEINRGFDSRRGPLVRFALLVDELPGSPASLFVITISHLISDAESMRIIVDELSHAYRELTHHRAPGLPAARDYHEYAGQQHAAPSDEDHGAEVDYWRETFHCNTAPRPWRRRSTAGHHMAVGDPGQYEQILRACTRSSLSVHSVLLSAYSLMLAAVKEDEIVTIGLPTSSRGPQWAGSTVGVFANLVPVVVNTAHASPSNFVRAVDACTRTALNNRLPYHEVVDLFRQTTGSTDDPVDNQFSVNHSPIDRLQLGDAVGTFVPAYVDKCEFPLGVGAERAGDALRIFFEYDTGIFTSNDISEMARQYFTCVDSLVEHLEHRGAGS